MSESHRKENLFFRWFIITVLKRIASYNELCVDDVASIGLQKPEISCSVVRTSHHDGIGPLTGI